MLLLRKMTTITAVLVLMMLLATSLVMAQQTQQGNVGYAKPGGTVAPVVGPPTGSGSTNASMLQYGATPPPVPPSTYPVGYSCPDDCPYGPKISCSLPPDEALRVMP